MSKDALLLSIKRHSTDSILCQSHSRTAFISCRNSQTKNGAHMLRHTFATLLYKKQKDLVLVQEALGHASLNTSRIHSF